MNRPVACLNGNDGHGVLGGADHVIKLTRLDRRELVVNADLVEFIEATPETIISMTTGKKVVVKESVDEVIRRIVEFRHRALPTVKSAVN